MVYYTCDKYIFPFTFPLQVACFFVCFIFFKFTYIFFKSNDINIQRKSEDESKDRYYGDRLLELCLNTGLCIYNGRAGEDKGVGKATTKFKTVVDYVVGSPNLINRCSSFVIQEYDPIFSDAHCKLVYSFDIKDVNTNEHNEKYVGEFKEYEANKETGNLKWKCEGKDEFITSVKPQSTNG